MRDVTLLYFDGCPSWQQADGHLRVLSSELELRVRREKVETPEAAERLRFRGSPTILVDGRDVFARGDEPVGLSCRIHQTPDGPAGSPTLEMLREVLASEPSPTVDAPGHPTVDELDAAVAGATPALDDGDRRLVAATLRQLAGGTAATPTALADAADLPIERVEQRLAEWPGVFRGEDGEVVGFWGLTVVEMPPHRMAVEDGPTVWPWCAWDPLFLAPIVGPARVETTDPVTGEAIRYELSEDGELRADDDQVVSFLLPEDTWTEDVLGSFCHHVLHFADRRSGEQWVAEHPGTFLLPLADAAELGRRHAARIATA